jgi:regulator of RNase E activity RraA
LVGTTAPREGGRAAILQIAETVGETDVVFIAADADIRGEVAGHVLVRDLAVDKVAGCVAVNCSSRRRY